MPTVRRAVTMESLLGVRTIRENLDEGDIKIVYAHDVKRAKNM